MSLKTLSKVWEWSEAQGTDRLVMLALADFCDDDDECFPGVARIAKKCRISERSVQRAFQTLVGIKELSIEPGKGIVTKHGFTNRFKLHLKGCQSVTPSVDGVTTEVRRGDNQGKDGVTALSPKPSGEPSVKPPESRGEELKALSLRVGAIMKRKPSTEWNLKERKALKNLFPVSEEDIQAVEKYYALPPSVFPSDREGRTLDIRRRDLFTLLNNWPGEVDRANNFQGRPVDGKKPLTPEQVDYAKKIALRPY